MLRQLSAIGRARTYGYAALSGAVALAGWLGYLAWSGRWAELDPVYATSAVILLWVYTLLDARSTVAALRDEVEALQRRDAQLMQQLRDERLRGDRRLIDRHGLP